MNEEINNSFLTISMDEKHKVEEWGIDGKSEIGDIYGLELIRKEDKQYTFNFKKLYHQSK